MLPTAPRRGPPQRWRAFRARRIPCQPRLSWPPQRPDRRSRHLQPTTTADHPARARSSTQTVGRSTSARFALAAGADERCLRSASRPVNTRHGDRTKNPRWACDARLLEAPGSPPHHNEPAPFHTAGASISTRWRSTWSGYDPPLCPSRLARVDPPAFPSTRFRESFA